MPRNPILILNPKKIYRENGFWGLARATYSLYEQPTPEDPWVGYAGQYAEGLHWVGTSYFNFAELEQYPNFIGFVADRVAEIFASDFAQLKENLALLKGVSIEDIIISGSPLGGYDITRLVAQRIGCRAIKAEKKVLEVGKNGKRDKTELVMDRYDVGKDDIIFGGEDTINNHGSTLDMDTLYSKMGANFVGLISVLDRTMDPTIDHWYTIPQSNKRIFISRLMRAPMKQFHQDYPLAATAIATNNIYWKPKKKWRELKAIMQQTALASE